MAQTPSRSNKKRLASAKTISAKKDADAKGKKKDAKNLDPLTKAEMKANRRKKISAIAIAVFAVLMAVSMMLPSLSSIFAQKNAASEAESQQETKTDDSNSKDEGATQEKTGIEAVDAKYEKSATALEKKLNDNPDDLASLLNLGNSYMNWGYAASAYATDDASSKHVGDLFQKAIDYYNKYLEKNDSPAVKVNIALCTFYSGNTDGAKEYLKKMLEATPDYGPAWANLGLCYEAAGDKDQARAAYKKAEETDPNDEYGAKSYASQRLAQLDAAATSTEGATTGETSATGTQGLSSDLASKSGTNY